MPVPGKNAAQTGETPAAVEPLSLPARSGPKTIRVNFFPPDVDDFPGGAFGEAVRLGRNIFNDTQTYARAYVGNGLNCVNCHLDEGRKADSAPLWAAYGMFPAYREKNRRVNSYEDRLTGCFRFSMNGKAPPPGSKELIALMSYSYWLSKGAPVGTELAGRGYPKLVAPQQPPDEARGKSVFEANCAICPRRRRAGDAGQRSLCLSTPVGQGFLQCRSGHDPDSQCCRVHSGQHAAWPGQHADRAGSMGCGQIHEQPLPAGRFQSHTVLPLPDGESALPSPSGC